MSPSDHDTPVETRYPWIGWTEGMDELPEKPTERDYARAYATMAAVNQAQKQKLIEELEKHDREREDTLSMLRTIRKELTTQQPMPVWAKVHSVVIAFEAFGIGLLMGWHYHLWP